MAYSSIAVANFFIEKAIETKATDFTPMKLQKLVYFAHGWYLALYNKPLLTDRIQAWRFGPVINSLYKETKKWGDTNITALLSVFDPESMNVYTPKIEEKEVKEFLESIWNAYSKHSAIKLSNATHAEGSPWDLTIKSNGGNIVIIDDKDIAQYFTSLANAG